jgi:ABC-2 type transport system permease protein
MAVYKRTYKGYAGGYTARWSRFLILPRYSYQRLFQSKFLMLFRIACLIYPMGLLGYIYLAHNMKFLGALGANPNFITVNSSVFLYFCNFQGVMSYIMTALIGPTLVSPDLANNALPSYFCRPFSRTEYVLGRVSVLVWVLSAITWIPGLILFAVQAELAGWEWTKANWYIAMAIVVGSFLWIAMLSLVAMAMSAWVKWKVLAGTLIIGIFVVGAGFGAVINNVMRTKNGSLIDLLQMNFTIWARLFRISALTSDISTYDACMAVLAACVLSVWLITRKVRAFEVVK